MATFVILYKFTEQGVRNIKDSPKRTEAAVKAAARAGMTIRETLWLQGEYDFMAIVEGPDESGGDCVQHQYSQAGQCSFPHHARLHRSGDDEDPGARRLERAAKKWKPVFRETAREIKF